MNENCCHLINVCRLCSADGGSARLRRRRRDHQQPEEVLKEGDLELEQEEDHRIETALDALQTIVGDTFAIQLNNAQCICDSCVVFLKDCIAFRDQIQRVDKMFSDLESAGTTESLFFEPNDWDEIRAYYNVDTCDWKSSDVVRLDHGNDILDFLFDQPEAVAESETQELIEVVLSSEKENVDIKIEEPAPRIIEIHPDQVAESSDEESSSSESKKRKRGRPKQQEGNEKSPPAKKSSSIRPKQSFECNLCGKMLASNYALHVHKQSHSSARPFECRECGKTFGRSDVLRNHLVIHTGQKPFNCQECGRNFTRSADLKSHLRIHDESKPFICKECGRGFKRAGDLKSHLGTHVRKEKFECDLCQKKFLSLGGLQYHLKVHTGEKPYTCPHCGMGFRQSGNMSKHMKIHH